MKILQIHNKYVDRGGEEVVLDREFALLKDAGHDVDRYIVSNESIDSVGKKIKTLVCLPYSLDHKKKVEEKIKEFSPDVVHVHNTFPLLTASVFYAAKNRKMPVVMTIHNYRLLCINGLFFRDNRVCTDCISKRVPTDGLIHNCYRDSKAASLMPVVNAGLHSYMDTWRNKVDKFIFLTPFAKNLFKQSHLDLSEEQMVVKPNFDYDNGFEVEKGNYFLFAGRLSREKGIDFVIREFAGLNEKLIIVGEGPLKEHVIKATDSNANIEYYGHVDAVAMANLYKGAKALIFASIWYEGMPLVILEAFSKGTPVITANLGNGGDMVTHKINGLTYKPRERGALLRAVNDFKALDQKQMAFNARKEYEMLYTPQDNLTQLMTIYNEAIENYKK